MGNLTAEYRHVPVMLSQVLAELDPKVGEVVCDCTLGGAGHSVELARRIAPEGLLVGIDQDDMALEAATARLASEVPEAEVLVLKGNFSQMDDLLTTAEIPGVDCFLFDLGVSSPQLDIPERGFSYNEDAPLDMRMDPDNNTLTAAEVINHYNEADLVRILRMYGDERHAPRIAARIVSARSKAPITSTLQLAELVKSAIPAAARRRGEALEEGLTAAVRWANSGGRICVISYHSLEDRIVSHVFSEMSRGCTCPPDFPVCVCGNVPILHVRTRKALVADADEVEANPRARSALMRVAEKL